MLITISFDNQFVLVRFIQLCRMHWNRIHYNAGNQTENINTGLYIGLVCVYLLAKFYIVALLLEVHTISNGAFILEHVIERMTNTGNVITNQKSNDKYVAEY